MGFGRRFGFFSNEINGGAINLFLFLDTDARDRSQVKAVLLC